jgi:hypothetical protein
MKIEVDTLIYELNNDEATVVGNKIDKIIDLVIPRKINYENKEYIVTEIAPQVFKNNRFINWVSIPSTIKKVGAECFASSSVKELYFEQIVALHEVEIGESMCNDSIRLEYVHLASGITIIPSKCFYNCISLIEINTPWRLTNINSQAYYNCYNLKHFDFTELITSIGEQAFYGTNINYAEIGEKVQSVKDLAFANIENLKTLVVASQHYEMGDQIISNQHRVTVYLKGTEQSQSVTLFKEKMSKDHYYVTDDFILLEQNGIRYIKFSKNLARILSYNETDIESYVTIPEQIEGAPVTDFQPGAFKYSKKIENFVFPKSILRNKGKVFEGASNLKKVVFQHKLTLNEARWIVSNDNVEIEIANKNLKRGKPI